MKEVNQGENIYEWCPGAGLYFSNRTIWGADQKAAKLIREADYILFGLGAGISTAAGAQYGGDFFKGNFGEFIEKYGAGPYMQDMYSAGFYPYPDENLTGDTVTTGDGWRYWVGCDRIVSAADRTGTGEKIVLPEYKCGWQMEKQAKE